MNIIEKSYKLNGTLKLRSKTNRIILHHAAAKSCTPDEVDSWHKQRGWTCIGYHFFVRKDGSIYRCRPENTIGAHASDNNSDSIGICAEGNFEVENMPEVQKQAIIWLIHSYLKPKYGNLSVLRHKDVGSTDCPGKNYPFEAIKNGTGTPVQPVQPVQNIVAHVTVTCEELNIRSGAGILNKVVAKAHKGGEYDVYEIKGDWGRINGGWFNLKYTSYNKSTVSYYPACGRGFVSIISALNSIGVNSSFDYRKKIAQKNNVRDYTGTVQQNKQLLEKLKAGRLIKI